MTYNIKHGQTNAACTQPAATPGQPPAPDCNLDLQAAIGVIREHNPDIVGLQEVDRFWARSGYQDEPEVLSAALGMEHRCYAANLVHPPDTHSDRPHQYGTLILSRFPIRTCSTTLLPRTGENEQRGFTLRRDRRARRARCGSTTRTCTRPRPTGCSRRPSSRRPSTPPPPDRQVMVGDFNARPTATELAAALRPVHRRVGQGRQPH